MSDQTTNTNTTGKPKHHNAAIRPQAPAPPRHSERPPALLPAVTGKSTDVSPLPGQEEHDTAVHPTGPRVITNGQFETLQAEIARLSAENRALKDAAHTAAMLIEAAGVNTRDKPLPQAVDELVKDRNQDLENLRVQYRTLSDVVKKTRIVLSLVTIPDFDNAEPLNIAVGKLSTAYRTAEGNLKRATGKIVSLTAEATRQGRRAKKLDRMLQRRARATRIRKAVSALDGKIKITMPESVAVRQLKAQIFRERTGHETQVQQLHHTLRQQTERAQQLAAQLDTDAE